MEGKEDPTTLISKNEGRVGKIRDFIEKITDRRPKDWFQVKSSKPHLNIEEEMGSSLDESEYDEDDPLADI